MYETMARAQSHPGTVGAAIKWCAAKLDGADVYFGHGTDNAIDEAAALVFHVVGLEHDGNTENYTRVFGGRELARLRELLSRRIERRIPTPYLLHEAWFGGLAFYVDQRVLIPRSPFAELIAQRFEPWVDPARVQRILEIGTGSGCIAIACALAFPASEIVATDLSADALDVARINLRQHELTNRVRLLETDLYHGVDGRYDLIVSNPPYVPSGDMPTLPAEFAHEPPFALASGADGLDSARRILQYARKFLRPAGMLALEVGAGWTALEAAFPDLPFVWPVLEHGGEGIALLAAENLPG